MFADYEGDISNLFNMHSDEEIPFLTTRNMVLFPGMLTPILIGRKPSMELINDMKKNPDAVFAVFSQRDSSVDDPKPEDLCEYGVFAKLVRTIAMPGGNDNITAIIQGLGRCRRADITTTKPYFMGHAQLEPEQLPADGDSVFATALADLRSNVKDYIRNNEDIPDEMLFNFTNISNDMLLVNYACTMLPFSVADKEGMLKAASMTDRVIVTLKALSRERQFLQLKQNIRSKTREDIYEQQRILNDKADRALAELKALRAEIDPLIVDIWNQVEAHFADLPPETRFDECRRYGLIYYYRTGEKKPQ